MDRKWVERAAIVADDKNVNIARDANIVMGDKIINEAKADPTDTIIGLFPSDSNHHHVPEKHIQSYTTDLAKVEACIRTSEVDTNSKQKLFVLHGATSTGKSTLARVLFNAQGANYENRIWINAESSESLEKDFGQLFQLMMYLQNHNSIGCNNQEIRTKLPLLYRSLLRKSTLLVFDNAAALDLNPKNPMGEVYNLVPYLPTGDYLVSKNMKPPTVVISTRGVLDVKSAVFSVTVHTNLPIFPVSLDLQTLRKQLDKDLQLVAKHETGRLSAWILAVISFVGPEEKVVVDLLVHLYCKCRRIPEFLKVSKPKLEDVTEALKLLQSLSLVRLEGCERQVVELPETMKTVTWELLRDSLTSFANFSGTMLEEVVLESVSQMVSAENLCNEIGEWCSIKNPDRKNYDMDLEELCMWACNLNKIIRSLYFWLLKGQFYNQRPDQVGTEFITLAFHGTSYDAQHQLLSDRFELGFKLPVNVTKAIEREIRIVSLLLGHFDEKLFKPQDNDLLFTPILRQVLWGDFKAADREYTKGGFRPNDSTLTDYLHTLYLAECNFKMGLYDDALEDLAKVGSPVLRTSSAAVYYSALPPAAIKASILTSKGKYLEARDFLKSSLELSLKENGRHSPTTVALEHALAKIEPYFGNSSVALNLIDHVIQVRLKFFGATSVRFIKAVATKAKILALAQDFEEAYQCLKEAQEGFLSYYLKRSQHLDHPHCLILRYYQAKILLTQNRYDEAEEQIEEVLSIEDEYCRESRDSCGTLKTPLAKHFSDSNHYWLKYKLLHGQVLWKKRKYEESRKVFENLIQRARAQQVFGDSNPRTLKFKLAYAESLELCDVKVAESLAESVLATADPEWLKLRLQAKGILAAKKIRDGEEEGGLCMLKEIVAESDKIAGCTHPHLRTFKFKLDLGNALRWSSESNLDEAVELVRRISSSLGIKARGTVELDGNKALNLLKSPQQVAAKYNEAIALACQGQFVEAYESVSDFFLEDLPELPPFTRPDAAEVSTFFAFLKVKISGNEGFRDAANWCNSSVLSLKSQHGEDHLKTLQAKLNLAAVCLVCDRDCLRADKILQKVRMANDMAGDSKFYQRILQLQTYRLANKPSCADLHYQRGGILYLNRAGT